MDPKPLSLVDVNNILGMVFISQYYAATHPLIMCAGKMQHAVRSLKKK